VSSLLREARSGLPDCVSENSTLSFPCFPFTPSILVCCFISLWAPRWGVISASLDRTLSSRWPDNASFSSLPFIYDMAFSFPTTFSHVLPSLSERVSRPFPSCLLIPVIKTGGAYVLYGLVVNRPSFPFSTSRITPEFFPLFRIPTLFLTGCDPPSCDPLRSFLWVQFLPRSLPLQ